MRSYDSMAFCRALLASSSFATVGGASGLAGGLSSAFAAALGGASGLGAVGLSAGVVPGAAGAFSGGAFSSAANCRKACPYMVLCGNFAFNSWKAAMASWVRPAF